MRGDRHAEAHAAHRWEVPAEFNIADACCRRWARDRARFALYWEDESGERAAFTFWDLDRAADRLASALAARGVRRGDRIAVILPQRPETVVAHMAAYRMGAIAVPLSFLFGADALEFRLADSQARVAFVDPQSLPNLAPIRDRLPELAHVVGVAGAVAPGIEAWEAVLGDGRPEFDRGRHARGGPGADRLHQRHHRTAEGRADAASCLLGNLPGFVHSHDGYPQPGDLFWSPADWAWTGGLMDALLPTLYFGQPIVGYRGRFDPGQRVPPDRALPDPQHVPVPDRAQADDEGVSAAARLLRPQPAQHHERRRSRRHDGLRVGAACPRRDDQRDVRPDRAQLHRRQFAHAVAGEARLDGPPLPRPPHRGDRRRTGREVPRGEAGEIAVHRVAPDGAADPVFFLEYFRNPEGTRRKYTGDWCRTGDIAIMDADGYLWYQGRSDDVFKVAGYRVGPSEIENCLVRHPAVANAAVIPVPDETRGNVVKAFIVLAPEHEASAALVEALQAARAPVPRAVRGAEVDRVPRRAADDDHRQGPAQAARASASASRPAPAMMGFGPRGCASS